MHYVYYFHSMQPFHFVWFSVLSKTIRISDRIERLEIFCSFRFVLRSTVSISHPNCIQNWLKKKWTKPTFFSADRHERMLGLSKWTNKYHSAMKTNPKERKNKWPRKENDKLFLITFSPSIPSLLYHLPPEQEKNKKKAKKSNVR